MPEGDGEPFHMTIDACFLAVRAGDPLDVQVIVGGRILHGLAQSGTAMTVAHNGEPRTARCIGLTMSTPVNVILSGIDRFDPAPGDYMYVGSTVPDART